MSDETELNPEHPDEQAAIERSLRNVMLPETAIDHDSVMYRAGWAAALAERDALEERDALAERDVPKPIMSSTTSRLWPALAATFAATTAACLLVIFSPPQTDDASVAKHDTSSGQVSPESPEEQSTVKNGDQEDVAQADSRSSAQASFSLAQLLTSPIENMIEERNVQLEKRFAELASPTRDFPIRDFTSEPDDDWKVEPLRPFTPRSTFSFPLLKKS